MVEKFALMVSGIVLACAAGHIARQRGWMRESSAGPLMFRLVVLCWAPASMLVLWQLPLQWNLICLPVIGALVPVALAPVGLGLARLGRLDRIDTGTFLCTVGTSNIGFTMGGFVCYCLFGMEGLGYAQLYACSWTLPYVGFYYSVARRFGEEAAVDLRFVLRTLLDRRSLPVLAALVGVTLNLSGVPMPAWIKTWRILDTWIILTVLLSFAIMGLQLHFSNLGDRKRLQAMLAGVKFCVAPLVAWMLVSAAQKLLPPLPLLARQVVIVQSFMPTAIYAVVIANLFHLNARLAGRLFMVNTVLFLAIVLPVLVFVFGSR